MHKSELNNFDSRKIDFAGLKWVSGLLPRTFLAQLKGWECGGQQSIPIHTHTQRERLTNAASEFEYISCQHLNGVLGFGGDQDLSAGVLKVGSNFFFFVCFEFLIYYEKKKTKRTVFWESINPHSSGRTLMMTRERYGKKSNDICSQRKKKQGKNK